MSTASTEEPAGNTAASADEAARREWFGQFGYKGDLTETVTLREGLGTATVADVWAVLRGVMRLQTDYRGAFHRLVNSAEADRRPVDPAERLRTPEYGELTDSTHGTWHPCKRRIVAALTVFNEDSCEGGFAPHPLVPGQEARKAA